MEINSAACSTDIMLLIKYIYKLQSELLYVVHFAFVEY